MKGWDTGQRSWHREIWEVWQVGKGPYKRLANSSAQREKWCEEKGPCRAGGDWQGGWGKGQMTGAGDFGPWTQTPPCPLDRGETSSALSALRAPAVILHRAWAPHFPFSLKRWWKDLMILFGSTFWGWFSWQEASVLCQVTHSLGLEGVISTRVLPGEGCVGRGA